MEAGDHIKFRFDSEAQHEGIDKDAVGVVLKAYDLPANPARVDVQFEGKPALTGWHQSRFVRVGATD